MLPEIVQYLAENKADINLPSNSGIPPIYIAMLQKHKPIVLDLLNRGADVSIITSEGNTSLHWSLVGLRDVDICDILIQRGVDVNGKNLAGLTALIWAVSNKEEAITGLLLGAHADGNIPDKSGIYPLHIATQNDSLNMINLLIKHCNVNNRSIDSTQITAIWLAAQNGKIDIIKILADNGADLNIVRADTGMPPIHVAMQKKHLEVANELLSRGANVNIVDAGGFIALHWAANLGDADITNNILKKGIDINSRTNTGATSLFIATSTNHKEVAKLLLDNNADPLIPCTDGTYSWHSAAFSGYIDIMHMLISKTNNIDLKTANTEQYTALWLAAQNGHNNIVEWLVHIGADVNAARQSDGRTVLQSAITNKNHSVVKTLVENKAEVNKGDIKQFTPIYYATEVEDLNTIKLLLQYNANIHLAGTSGDQPIHMASFLCNILIMKILLDRGVNIDSQNTSGNTSLHEVLLEENKAVPDKKITAVKYLLAHHANSNIPNAKGETAIDLAKLHCVDVVPYLEHPDTLPSLAEFEVSIIGSTQELVI